MFTVYILYSQILDRYYVGETLDMEERIQQHNTGYYSDSYTKQSSDWCLYFKLECESRTQARKIESHIKKMKSRKYIQNLSKYPEISEKLLKTYRSS